MAMWRMPQPTSTRRSSWPSCGTPGAGEALKRIRQMTLLRLPASTTGMERTARKVDAGEVIFCASIELRTPAYTLSTEKDAYLRTRERIFSFLHRENCLFILQPA